MLSTIKSELGQDMVIDELQYVYSRNGSNRDKSALYWKCVRRRDYTCTAPLHTKTKLEGYNITKSLNEHNHSSSISKIEMKESVNDLKLRAKDQP